jgi:hypothetical protein
VFLDDGYCSTSAVEIDPDEGCMTYTQSADMLEDDHWDDEDELLDDGWEDLDFDEEEDDLWLDDEDDF